jgi:hypothetical protein
VETAFRATASFRLIFDTYVHELDALLEVRLQSAVNGTLFSYPPVLYGRTRVTIHIDSFGFITQIACYFDFQAKSLNRSCQQVWFAEDKWPIVNRKYTGHLPLSPILRTV